VAQTAPTAVPPTVAAAASVSAAAPVSANTAVEFQPGERVVLLGGAFIERLQVHGHLESRLVATLGERQLVFRNLGWSGDTVWGEARAVFGGPPDGFKRLVNDTVAAKPTMILLQYGAAEAHAGPAGLGEFQAQLGRLLDTLAVTKARLVLLSPTRRERPTPSFPDPAAYNANLGIYCETLAKVARERGLAYVDLQDLFDHADANANITFTDNGLHPHEVGYAVASERIASRLNAAYRPWSVEIEGTAGKSTSGVAVKDVQRTGDAISFRATAATLPSPPVFHNRQPATFGTVTPAGKRYPMVEQHSTLRVAGLAAGDYELRVEGQVAATATAAQFAAGVRFENPADMKQAESLRQAICEKNTLYFHRYRPQNETYLFLFRKHEQGNNAVEIPQFDPLIAEKEAAIQTLRMPVERRFEIVKR
jgi:lysophospholipase L1-like esterase